MNLTTENFFEQWDLPAVEIDPQSLYHAMEHVQDQRKCRGKRYPLALVMTLLLLGKLAGQNSIQGIREWIAWRQQWLQRALGWPRRFPSQATYTRALAACDGEELAYVLGQALLKAHKSHTPGRASTQTALRQVAIDGKTLRGALEHHHPHQPSVHVLSCYDPESGITLAHRAVEEKTNEIGALATWLNPSLVKDRIVTADAMHTQRAMCADLIRFAGHYVLFAKGNQPTLYEDIRTFFTDPQADEGEWEEEYQWSKGHGRLEQRRIRTTTLLTPLFSQQ